MNPESRIKYYSSLKQKKYREKENKFLIEGIHLLEECLKSDYHIETVFICENLLKSRNDLIYGLIAEKKIPVVHIKNKDFIKLSDTDNPQGIMAVVEKKSAGKIDYSSSKLIVALDGISDPGNLGTIIRTCHWFGVQKLLLSTGSVDLYNPKVVRSTQGSLFHVIVLEKIDLTDELRKLSELGFNVIFLDVNADNELENMPVQGTNALVFGNESEGISNKLLNSSYRRFKIKGYSDCESLNLAVSCGIALNILRK
jgi:TrmH family RNA methyltransferase